jgi:carboxylate-amine ligase
MKGRLAARGAGTIVPPLIDHNFTGPAFTVGIEEELMLLHADGLDLAQEIEAILAAVPPAIDGQVKPELMQSVLEVATKPCAGVTEAVAELAVLRRSVIEIAEERGLRLAAAGTHPFAEPNEQLIVDRPRYRELADELGYIARQELIFGTHVHVAIEGADRAIYVADGIRQFLPLFLALSTNSPFWRREHTGMMSARTPVFRAFPRVGIPPHYGTWEIYSHRVETMVKSGAIDDYTYLWWDVRPHPNLGTVETRVFDQQTKLADTAALAALTVALARRFSRNYDAGEPLVEQPGELVDDNKVRAALRGMEGDLVDFRGSRHIPATDIARRVVEELAEDAAALGCETELAGIDGFLVNGTGARRQLARYEREPDLLALVSSIVDETRV